eukprot:scaffold142898_cov15-Tisochrysis_lutea.AAC.1
MQQPVQCSSSSVPLRKNKLFSSNLCVSSYLPAARRARPQQSTLPYPAFHLRKGAQRTRASAHKPGQQRHSMKTALKLPL